MTTLQKELVFQVVLIALVFLFYSFDAESPGFRPSQVAFFSTHVLAAWAIGYWLMPGAGMEMPLTEAALAQFRAASKAGLGGEDDAAVAKVYAA